MAEIEIGKVEKFFAKPVVAAIALTGALERGDRLRIKGHTTDMELTVDSIQVDNQAVASAKAGEMIGIKVPDRARPGDVVYKITA